MRIAVASDNGKMVASQSEPCKGFVIFDLREGAIRRLEYRDHATNAAPAAIDPPGATRSGREISDALADCQALVTRGLCPHLIAELAKSRIPAYLCCVEDVEKAAAMFAAGSLTMAEARGIIPETRH